MTTSASPGALEVLGLGLSIGASAAGVLGAIWAVTKLALRWWEKSFGRRRAQAKILDQIACTVSMKYIDTVLGTPMFVTHPYGTTLRTEYLYRLPGAWVAIEASNEAVQAYSITIVDPKMYYDIGEMSNGMFKICLGKDTFAQVDKSLHDGEKLWVGAHTLGYVRSYQLGKPSKYQRFWLSFNEGGAGPAMQDFTPFTTGVYGDAQDARPDTASIAVNTFSAFNGSGDHETRQRTLFGPHIDQLRFARADSSYLKLE